MNETIYQNKNKENFLKEVKKRKKEIEKHFADNFVIGMGLNLYYYLASIVKYELIKAEVCEEKMDKYLTEEYLTREFGDIFDNCFYYNENNDNNEGKIYENFKKEIWLSIVQKEVALNNEKEVIKTIEDKYKKIMNWFEPIFENKQLYTSDNPEVFGMYELYYLEDNEEIVFHTGGGKPFIFREGVTFEQFSKQVTDGYEEKRKNRKQIEKERKSIEKKLKEEEKEMLKKMYHTEQMTEVYKNINLLHEKKTYLGDAEKEIKKETEKLLKITKTIKKITKEIKKEHIGNIYFEKGDVTVKFNNYHNLVFPDNTESYYEKIKEEIEKTEIKTAVSKRVERLSGNKHNVEVKIKTSFKNDDIELKLSFKTLGMIKIFERTIKKENDNYQYKEKKMKNMDEVYLFVEKYTEELARRLEASRKNAEEFFFSNLSKKEEDVYHQFGFVEIVSEDKVYLLKKRKALATHHILIVWDKKDEELKDAKCYCIERVQKQLEEYDEMASVLLALKTKEFDYIEENANKFGLNAQTKKEIKERYLSAKKTKEAI